MFELVNHKIGIELPVDTGEQIEVELFGNACLVVIGIEDGLRVLFKIETDDGYVARRKVPAQFFAKLFGFINGHISDIRPHKKHYFTLIG